MTPWWWFPCKPKHVEAASLILRCFNNSIFFNVVCISRTMKYLISLMHGVTMKYTGNLLYVTDFEPSNVTCYSKTLWLYVELRLISLTESTLKKYRQTPIERHVLLPPAKVLKEKFSIIHNFRIPSPSIYSNKLRIIISGAVSEIERSWNRAYEFSLSLLVRLKNFSLLRSSKCSYFWLVYNT